jgi:hypothetical protein
MQMRVLVSILLATWTAGCASAEYPTIQSPELVGTWELTGFDGQPVLGERLGNEPVERLHLGRDGRYVSRSPHGTYCFGEAPDVVQHGRWQEWSDGTLRLDVERTEPASDQPPTLRQLYVLDRDTLYLIRPPADGESAYARYRRTRDDE